MMQLNSDEIQQILPHRYPFLLVDRITECEPGKKACGIKCVSANEMHFVGHFPQKKVMPGVLIIEALAQTGAVALLSEEKEQGTYSTFLQELRMLNLRLRSHLGMCFPCHARL